MALIFFYRNITGKNIVVTIVTIVLGLKLMFSNIFKDNFEQQETDGDWF